MEVHKMLNASEDQHSTACFQRRPEQFRNDSNTSIASASSTSSSSYRFSSMKDALPPLSRSNSDVTASDSAHSPLTPDLISDLGNEYDPKRLQHQQHRAAPVRPSINILPHIRAPSSSNTLPSLSRSISSCASTPAMDYPPHGYEFSDSTNAHPVNPYASIQQAHMYLQPQPQPQQFPMPMHQHISSAGANASFDPYQHQQPPTPPTQTTQSSAARSALRPGQKKNQYPCPLASDYSCTEHFTTSGHAARHAKKHTGKKDAICPECHKAFTRKDNMEQHRRTHLAGRSNAPPKSGSTDESKRNRAQLKLQHDTNRSKKQRDNSAANVAEGMSPNVMSAHLISPLPQPVVRNHGLAMEPFDPQLITPSPSLLDQMPGAHQPWSNTMRPANTSSSYDNDFPATVASARHNMRPQIHGASYDQSVQYRHSPVSSVSSSSACSSGNSPVNTLDDLARVAADLASR